MNFYSYQGQEPQVLPERLRLDDGTTITSLHKLSDQELNSYGFIGPVVEPEINPETQKLVWSENHYDVVELTEEEITAIKNEGEKNILQGFKISNFWNLLYQTSFYHRLRKEAATHLQINVLYTEFVSLSKTYSDVGKYLNKLLLVVDFTEKEVEDLSNTLSFLHLKSVINAEYFENHSYDFDTDSIFDTTTRPFESWIWNGTKWVAPVDYPTDGKVYIWNESTKKWKVSK